MDLSIYNIVKNVIVTGKTTVLFKKLGKITFDVHKLANKGLIKDAVEKIWNVKVDKVCVVNVSGKSKIFGRKKFKSPGKKKAFVTLKKGYKIDLSSFFETMGAEARPSVKDDVAKEL